MVNLIMAIEQDGMDNDLAEDGSRRTKKSLRLSHKKQLILKRKREEIEQKEKEEKLRIENDKREKDEENNAVEIDEFDHDTKGKQKRHWGSWAKADKDLFFEAISEFGKDFDKICSYMDRKSKTRGKSVKECEPRNKDQIRYFYYRTWKQISKAVSLQPCESKRLQHELYCLICYGELRKKCRGFGNKDLKRLDELVTTGSTTVRHKGRKIRIKPPICRFLKKLIDDDDKSTRQLDSIPESIDVELYPHSNNAWTMAQCLAYNPRIRLNALPITLKVKSLIKLIERRFCTKEASSDDASVHLFPPKELISSKSVEIKSSSPNTLSTEPQANTLSQPLEKLNSQFDAGVPVSNPAAYQIAAIDPIIPSTSQPHILPGSTLCNAASTSKCLPNAPTTAQLTLSLPRTEGECSVVATTKAITNFAAPLLGGNVIASYACKNPTMSPSQSITPSADGAAASSRETKDEVTAKESGDEKSAPFFPLKTENCTEKDLQACFLSLNRPAVIRLEYDLETKIGKCSEYSDKGFDKLVMLAQRDLVKSVKVSTQPIKVTPSASRAAQTPRVTDAPKPGLASKSYITIPAPDPLFSGPKPVITTSTLKTTPVSMLPALTNVITPPSTNIIHRKVVPRPRPIQPAFKTLVAKAVAVNIVPQPARLVQYAQLPAVSTQLVNSGLPTATTTVSSPVIESPSARPATSTIFSVPTTSSLSTKLTIWSSPTSQLSDLSNKVQVEVIQEGGRAKAPVKRLHPTSVTETETPSKLPCLGSIAERKHPADANEFDLSAFLATTDDSRSEADSQIGSESINLSTILSGLTKNLCKNGTEKSSKVSNFAESKEARSGPIVSATASTKDPTSPEQLPMLRKFAAAVSEAAATTTVSSVLTTPVKCPTATPSKSENDGIKMQPVNFEHNWFGGDISELSLSGILDVGNMKDTIAKSCESSQASEISISKLLNDVQKKDELVSPVAVHGPDISLGTILGTSEKNSEDKKPSQISELSITKLLDVVRKSEKPMDSVNPPEIAKNYDNDSLIMKPDADPVAVFESLMEENSVDYINKFKALTAKMKGDEQSNNAPTDASKGAHLPPVSVQEPPTEDSKDPKLPVYRSEDSVGILDDLSFVLPMNDSNSNDFS